MCKFTVACNRAFKQDDQLQKEVSFFDVSTWTRLAEACAEYLNSPGEASRSKEAILHSSLRFAKELQPETGRELGNPVGKDTKTAKVIAELRSSLHSDIAIRTLHCAAVRWFPTLA